ncbi:hypothetical protein LDC_3110, partial [sediment metagenome]
VVARACHRQVKALVLEAVFERIELPDEHHVHFLVDALADGIGQSLVFDNHAGVITEL